MKLFPGSMTWLSGSSIRIFLPTMDRQSLSYVIRISFRFSAIYSRPLIRIFAGLEWNIFNGSLLEIFFQDNVNRCLLLHTNVLENTKYDFTIAENL